MIDLTPTFTLRGRLIINGAPSDNEESMEPTLSVEYHAARPSLRMVLV